MYPKTNSINNLSHQSYNITNNSEIKIASEPFIQESAFRLRTPISTKQAQLCTRSNLKIVRQQRTTGDYYASRR